ncbi:MAG TPA: response regulator transcription factor [Burkholderiales bacterium]|nr:response regulator transcription factor [Burkholderiales bacterium]
MPASVLLVEEHLELRSALRDWLLTTFPPLELCEARSLDEALEAAERAKPDLALIDWHLPGTNGIEAARALHRVQPRCCILVMSVSDSEALRIAAVEAGAAALITKRDLTTGLHRFVAALSACR